MVRASSYLNCFKKDLESIRCPSYKMNAGSLGSMGFNNMMHAITINYYKWVALTCFSGEKERENTSEGKKEEKKFVRLPVRVLNSRPSCFLGFPIQYTKALS